MAAFGEGLVWAAVALCALAFLCATRDNARPVAVGALSLATAALSVAGGVLLVAVVGQDYGFEYVATQSRADSSAWYRVAALWAGAEGSLLMFATMVAASMVGATVLYRLRAAPIAITAVTVGGLAATVAVVANPFAVAELPAVRGAGLTPILEHPAMLYHPPLLYAGLAATAVPYLLVVARDFDRATARRWVLAAWTLLTIGLATGANWAYVELGWGGYWAWDPVENTVLIPWLVLAASIHLFRSRVGSGWLRPAVGAPFVLVALGAAVTRSGGLSSVHVFADSESMGVALAAWVVVVAAVLVWGVVGWRDDGPGSGLGRAGMTVAAAGGLLFMALVVLLGVMFPLAPGNDRILESSYYTAIGAPLLVGAMAALGFVGFASPQGARWPSRRAWAQLVLGAAVGLVLAVLLGVTGWFGVTAVTALGAAVAGTVHPGRPKRLAMTVGHLGMIVLCVGIVATSQATSTRVLLEPGDSVDVGGHELVFESFAVSDGPRTNSEQSTATVSVARRGSTELIYLTPSLVSYPDRLVVLAETGLHSTPFRDVQVVLRTIDRSGLATFDVAVRPGVMMVWWGSVLIAAAGLIAMVNQTGRPVASEPRARRVST